MRFRGGSCLRCGPSGMDLLHIEADEDEPDETITKFYHSKYLHCFELLQ